MSERPQVLPPDLYCIILSFSVFFFPVVFAGHFLSFFFFSSTFYCSRFERICMNGFRVNVIFVEIRVPSSFTGPIVPDTMSPSVALVVYTEGPRLTAVRRRGLADPFLRLYFCFRVNTSRCRVQVRVNNPNRNPKPLLLLLRKMHVEVPSPGGWNIQQYICCVHRNVATRGES